MFTHTRRHNRLLFTSKKQKRNKRTWLVPSSSHIHRSSHHFYLVEAKEVVEVGRGETTNFLRLLFVHFSSYWLLLLFRWLLPLLRIRQFIQQTMLTHLLHAYIKTEQMKRKNNSHGVQQKPSLNTHEWHERRLTCVCVFVLPSSSSSHHFYARP